MVPLSDPLNLELAKAEKSVEVACHELLAAPDSEHRRAWGVIFTAAIRARNALYTPEKIAEWEQARGLR